jgi:valyl-tRNA synthetase
MVNFPELDKGFENSELEAKCRTLWDDAAIYDYDQNSEKPLFSVDTPPPYVSAAHLHVGHAMSYTQAEIIIRYKRMLGFNIFYPMGFDDNGLPTERYVEQKHKVNKKKISRSDFRALCIDETQKGAKTYEELWRSLGLSVDWSLRYSTIDDRSRHTAQKSFLDLYEKGLIYRSDEPVQWDTHFETALAQADCETIERKGKMYDIAFEGPEGEELVISTTRPELLPACVAMYCNPDDARYKHLVGKMAKVPLSDGREVPIKTSEEVDVEFGTGLMQVCTFGDGEDVKKWKEDKLDTRIIMGPDGKMTEAAGKYAGLDAINARNQIANDLKEAGLIRGEKKLVQNVTVGERSEQPVEFVMAPQWFINVLDHKERFRARMNQLEWFPEWMKVRLEHWIDGLKYNWNISRQRFYGVPFPIWYVQETGDVILADEADLPLDPLENTPPKWAQEKYAGMTIVPETDVMETWMTSSVSPLINANWAGRDDVKGSMDIYPMDLRVQAFEIIRTWLFYTLIKAEYHTDNLPWKNVMISGWGLNEQGKKVSKRDLDKFTDANGYNRYDPGSVVSKYGADALRYWAANSQLGQDLRYHEKEVKDGRKVVVKLWNVARMAFMYMGDNVEPANFPKFEDRTLEDRWLLKKLHQLADEMTTSFEGFDYASAKEKLHKFFWGTFCDNYLELTKARFWENYDWDDAARLSAQATLYDSLRMLLGLFAPFTPFITEEIYQQAGKFGEDYSSLHVSAWPKADAKILGSDGEADMDYVLKTLAGVRRLRSEQQIGAGSLLESVTIALGSVDGDVSERLRGIEMSLLSAARAKALNIETANDGEDTAFAITPMAAEG